MVISSPLRHPPAPFFRYCVVGGLGTTIDVGTVFLLVHFFDFHPVFAAFFGFFLAVINNFLLNKFWTFQDTSKNYRKQGIKFFLVSLGGLLLTVGFMTVFYNVFHIHYLIAKILTSGVVLSWNFFANKYWTFRFDLRHIPVPKMFSYEVSVVIPAYNEEYRIRNTLILMNHFFQLKHISAEIIVVSDGSTDSTVSVVQSLSHDISHLVLLENEKNRGKGHAVSCGVMKSSGKYILLADADGSTPIEEYENLRGTLSSRDIAIGSRYAKGSKVRRAQSRSRVLLGRIGNSIIRFALIDDISDTQCGFKLFSHKAAKEIFSRQKIFRFAFDAEALVIAESLGYSISEVPVSWYNSPESRVRPLRDAVRTFLDILFIKINLWSGRYF